MSGMEMSLDERLARAERLVDLLDRGFVVPGTSFRFGLDPLIGLVPGVGDLISALSSLYVIELLSPGLPAFTRYRMFWNVFVDLLIGSVPVVGDLFDFAFKANTRNLQLARRALGREIDAAPALAQGT